MDDFRKGKSKILPFLFNFVSMIRLSEEEIEEVMRIRYNLLQLEIILFQEAQIFAKIKYRL